jgi:hypothetical protein
MTSSTLHRNFGVSLTFSRRIEEPRKMLSLNLLLARCNTPFYTPTVTRNSGHMICTEIVFIGISDF